MAKAASKHSPHCKKQREREYASGFLNVVLASGKLEDSECPDFWITDSHMGRIGLELVDYRSIEKDNRHGGITPSHREAALRELGNCMAAVMVELAHSKYIHVRLSLQHVPLPEKRYHRVLAGELVELLNRHLPSLEHLGKPITVYFFRSDLPKRFIRPDEAFETLSAFPLLARHVMQATISLDEIRAVHAVDFAGANGAFVMPQAEVFSNIFQSKLKKSQKYQLDGRPLWLLIACEVSGDVSSHIFPTNDTDWKDLREAIDQTQFDFAGSPFAQVWLYSTWTRMAIRVHPVDPGGKLGFAIYRSTASLCDQPQITVS
jgi:hypothetical protein